jgi:hypothetical protein
MNALFTSLWSNRVDFEKKQYFKAVVAKNNYGSTTIDYISLYDNYAELYAYIPKTAEVGNITFDISPV